MPIYVYECAKCKQEWEYMQSVSEPPKKKCEKCGGKLQKIIAPTAFVLKGGGWYKDLYSSSKPGGSKSESSSESKGESKAASGGSETKSSSDSGSSSGSGSGKSDKGKKK